MAQLSNDCFQAGEGLLTLEDAVALIRARIDPVAGRETAPLRSAENRVLAEDVASALDLPAFDNSAVDGYAVRFRDLSPAGETSLPVGGRVAAGQAPENAAAASAIR